MDEIAPATLLTTPQVGHLVVPGPQVRVVRVDQFVQVVAVLGLELFDRFPLLLGSLLGEDGLDVVGHGLGDLGIAQRPESFEAGDLAVLFSGDACEQLAAIDDFLDRLVEGDRLPLTGAAGAGALQHLDNAVRVVRRLQARLALGADEAVYGGRVEDRRLVGEVRPLGPRREGVAIDLHDHTVVDLGLDTALRVALLADRVDDVLWFGQAVFGSRGDAPGGRVAEHVEEPRYLARGHRRTAEKGRGLDEIAAAQAVAFGVRFVVRHLCVTP